METTQIATQVSDSSVGGYVCLGIMLVIIIVFVIALVKSCKKAKLLMENDKVNGVKQRVAFKHVNGLSLPENTMCSILVYDDRYEFSANGVQFNLPLAKITDVCCKTDVDIQKQYVSSVAGAVGGAVLFGPLGAMIGGRAKQKKVKKVSTYLIITYMDSDNNVKYIGFDVTDSIFVANSFVKAFKSIGANNVVKIDL